MSQIDRIAEINRLNNLLMIKHDQMSRKSRKPNQTVKPMMKIGKKTEPKTDKKTDKKTKKKKGKEGAKIIWW